jgi:hypothetical protein
MSPGGSRPAFVIMDGAHLGNPHFFFLPPMVPSPKFSGTFDGSRSPVVQITEDGSLLVDRAIVDDACVATLDERAHAGLLSFVDAAAASDVPPRRIKVQLTGPLTLGMALHAAGMPADRAFERGAAAARSWVGAIESLVAERLPAIFPRKMAR